MRLGQHPSIMCARAKRTYLETLGIERTVQRAHEIGALASKRWRGMRVYRTVCDGPFGNGPHVMYVSAGVLWSLISLEHCRCPFHR